MTFGSGPAEEFIPLPDPQIRNLRLAVAQVPCAPRVLLKFSISLLKTAVYCEDDSLMRKLEALVC